MEGNTETARLTWGDVPEVAPTEEREGDDHHEQGEYHDDGHDHGHGH